MISCDICKRFRQLRQRNSLAKKRKQSGILIFTNQKMHSNKWKGLSSLLQHLLIMAESERDYHTFQPFEYLMM